MGTTLPDYAAWHDERSRRLDVALDRLSRYRADTEAWARDLTARNRRRPSVPARRRADEAWEHVRTLAGRLDPLGQPVDPTFAGRAKFERAWLLATGWPYVHPEDDDTPPEHAAGEHDGTTLRRSFAGDLPPCSACMDDELWADACAVSPAPAPWRTRR